MRMPAADNDGADEHARRVIASVLETLARASEGIVSPSDLQAGETWWNGLHAHG